MEINIQNSSGKKAGSVTVPDAVFGARMNGDLVWQVATAQMSNKRQVLAHAKTRSEVRGGGRKPWRQKGTGRARHGSIRSPIWIGGGVAHGPSRDVNFKKIVPKSASRKALAVVLSARLKDGGLLVVDTLELASGKTKDGAKAMTVLTKGFSDYRPRGRVLVVLPGGKDDTMPRRALENLDYVQTMRAQDLNALAVLSFPFVLATRDAVGIIEKTLSSKK